ncbi:GGDEF domain-containing protein [Acetanaerobacterium elongatum]|nr:GGDEF domain-containing protein [Acetanaerobacterium elongatum]
MIKSEPMRDRKKKKAHTSLKTIYMLTMCLCSLVHGVYLAIFCLMGIWTLVAANAVSVIIYLLLAAAMQNEHFALALSVTHLEIMAQAMLTIIFVGWGVGFEYVVLSLLAMEPHFIYRHRRTPYLLCVAGLLLIMTLKVHSLMIQPIVHTADRGVLIYILFFINMVIFFFGVIFSAVLLDRRNRISRHVLEENNRYLQKLAETDPLTGLLNRRSMTKRLEGAIKHQHETGEEFCLVMCDIDDFKLINDSYGHACGDYVLKMLCATICEYLDEQDVVCRWGGEEILLLLSDTRLETALQITEGLRRAIETTPFIYDGAIVSITVTMGVSACGNEQNVLDLVDAADRSMYNGKRRGKNCVTVS